MALGADDPLLFGSRLAGQYATMRAAHDLSDDAAGRAGPDVVPRLAGPRRRPTPWLAEVDDWLARAETARMTA